jgi:hypothetical protein
MLNITGQGWSQWSHISLALHTVPKAMDDFIVNNERKSIHPME